ncbi:MULTISPECIES: thiol-disulfide oxidoreductase DCC family protein [Microbispora]|uniref:thiol-disulfide oxidoreductase DCC family protein n=1 Tax=Microbispora TaxID=2005 RepID=UPI0003DCD4D2|nr:MULTISPECIES: DCC1-like thiol-disulfide oxidoreductase family protein [Microbispora]ETK31442.1 thiol-disulfide oxidoreductase [Microbispora sp. ATCC PTA-5024]
MGGENRLLLVFDGECAFCQMCVNAGRRLLPYMPVVRAWQFVDLGALGLTRDEASASVQLVGPRGLHAHGARAIGVMLALQPHPLWRPLGRVMLAPPVSWAAEGAYRLVSRYRHLLPGASVKDAA